MLPVPTLNCPDLAGHLHAVLHNAGYTLTNQQCRGKKDTLTNYPLKTTSLAQRRVTEIAFEVRYGRMNVFGGFGTYSKCSENATNMKGYLENKQKEPVYY